MLDMLALGVMAPVLPKLVIGFMGGDVGGAAGIIGLFGFMWAAMQFVFSPILGSLSDRFGRRPVIILSNLGLGFDYVLMALAPALSWLFVGRTISGITTATFATAGAYISDVTSAEKRAARFGQLGAAFGLGFILGPAMGGFLGDISLRLPFWVSAAFSLANATYGLFVLPESLRLERRAGFEWRKANPMGSLVLLRSHPELFGLAMVIFLQRVAHDSLPSMFVLYTDYRYGWGAAAVGLALAAVGLSSIIVSGVLVGPIVARVGERRGVISGLMFGVAGFAIFGAAPTGALFLTGLPLLALWGIAQPSIQGLMTRRVASSEQGRLQGAQASLLGVAEMIGPLLFTQIFAVAIGDHGAMDLTGAPYLLAALLLTCALIVSGRVTRTSRSNSTKDFQVS